MFKRISAFGLVAFLTTLTACGAQYSGPPADLVVMNANIVTIDQDNPRAEAVAVIGEEIIAVTTNSAIQAYIGEDTEVIDAAGTTHDPRLQRCPRPLRGLWIPSTSSSGTSPTRTSSPKGCGSGSPRSRPGVMIRGGHWEHEMFDDKQWPTKELLDEVAPNNPVSLSRADGHSTLVNSYVLRASGITNDTPDPPGGEIQRDPVTGEATGIFKESAQGLLRYNAVPVERTPEEQAALRDQGWEDMLAYTRSLGVTSIQHPGGGNAETYQRMMDEGKLTVRVDVAGRLTADPDELARWDELRQRYPAEGNWIRFGYLKGFMDGTLGSGTAMFFEPFEDEPDKTGSAPDVL